MEAELLAGAQLRGNVHRIGVQDNRIIANVKAARSDAHRSATRLAVLQVRAKRVATRIQRRRDEIAAVQDRLVSVQNGLEATQASKKDLLGQVRSSRRQLEGDLSDMKEEQARISGTLNIPVGPSRFHGLSSLVSRATV